MATEKLTPAKITKDINNIEKALLGDVSALQLFTNADGVIAIPKSMSDGQGLSLMRVESGSWVWFYRYRIHGKLTRMSLGKYPYTTLAMARQKHKEAYTLRGNGIAPVAHREERKNEEKQKSIQTFKHVAEMWFDRWKAGDITQKHAENTWRRLENDMFPTIGKMSIHTITLKNISHIFEEIDKRAPVIAQKLWSACNNIFSYACIRGIIANNPLANIKRGDLLVAKHITVNQLRIRTEELPKLLRDIDNYDGTLVRIGLQLMTLTFVRHGELRGASWDEFDFAKKQWLIPASRMKMSTPHIVPLAKQTIELLEKLKEINGHRSHLFPSTKGDGRVMSDGTLNKALHLMGYKGRHTVHGFRGLASTALHELGYKEAHIELQLAHQPRNKVSSAYNHAKYIPERTKMMQNWADYLDKNRLESAVLE